MKHRLGKIAAIFMIGSVLALSTAHAEIIEVKSKIIEISDSALSTFIRVNYLNARTGKTEEIKVEVSDGTLFGEIGSLASLKVGDEVVIKADYDAYTHDWKAQSIRLYTQ